MSCQPMFLFVYFSLLLMTAGFVLTLCSWLAPLLNDTVYGVRIFGLVALLVGSFMLFSSCLVGGLNHGRCFAFCYMCGDEKKYKSKCATPSEYTTDVIENPLVVVANHTKKRASTHVSHYQGSGKLCLSLQQNHSSTQEKLCFSDQVNYGSCKVNIEPQNDKEPAPMREAVLVLSNDAVLGDNIEQLSRGSHVTPEFGCTERHYGENKGSSSDCSSNNSGQIRILKAYHRSNSSSDNNRDQVAESMIDLNDLECDLEAGDATMPCDRVDCSVRNQLWTAEDSFVHNFMSG